MIALGDVAVMGGGCYGAFYLGQLTAARQKGAVAFRRLLIIDRDPGCQAASAVNQPGCELVVSDWAAFLDRFLDARARDRDALTDMIVPTPLMPHLLAHWLERRAQARWPDRDVALVPVDTPLGTPYDRLHTDDVRYVSFADWICPTHCVEPLLCPAIKAPRTWEMRDAVAEWSVAHGRERPTAPPALLNCQHAAFGVGMYPVRSAFDGFDRFVPVADGPAGGDLMIGSISSCHGAMALLRVGPAVREPATVLYSPPYD